MRIAIIGGGASGLAAAWLLDTKHEVHLYERASTLGGHIRTVGGNVPCETIPSGVHLDAGVIEFDQAHFPAFHAWMHALDVPVRRLAGAGSSNLFLADGRHLHAPAALAAEHPALLERLSEATHLIPSLLRLRRFRRETSEPGAVEVGSVERFLSDDDFSVWVRCLLMYAYSMHYDEVHSLSGALAIPMLRAFLHSNDWTHIPGGVSTYVDVIARQLGAKVHTNTTVAAIHRTPTGARISTRSSDDTGDTSDTQFDAVVIAVPPHRVLPLLADADEAEHQWFGDHTGGTIETVLHTDTGLYTRRGIHAPTEFDLFALPGGGHGYNAYLNRLSGLPDPGTVAYSLGFDLDSELDPASILHRQVHDVAAYTERAMRSRSDIVAHNGHKSTWYVGAWLRDGLHEGAVRSACAVSERLGGRPLPGFTPE
jgi:predicted NAD/FAD-binding protein